MEFDLTKRNCYYFREISKIPHTSYHEKAISDWLTAFAREHGLPFIQDEWNNVIIYKEASKGYETVPPLMLQAHMDMVGAKEEGSSHNFETDPLDLRVKDGWLYAKGTTLGADDGHGVSNMLAILEDDSLIHPPLECVFTVREETGLEGAMKLKKEYFKSRRMIGLDANGETRTVISANGGCTLTVTLPLNREAVSGETFEIRVNGLLGGHSGKESLSERGNAIQVLARLLGQLAEGDESFRVCKLKGGERDNVIPSSASAIVVSSLSVEDIAEKLDESVKQVRELLSYSDPGLAAVVCPAKSEYLPVCRRDTEKLLTLLELLPSGLLHRDITRDNHGLASANPGIVSTGAEEASVEISLRSCVPPEVDYMTAKIKKLSGLLGAGIECRGSYPGYNFREHSPLRELYAEYTEKTLGRELELFAGNGGNEMGVMMAIVGDLDVISMGPWVYDNHTPRERMNLESFDLVYRQLRGFIELLAKEGIK